MPIQSARVRPWQIIFSDTQSVLSSFFLSFFFFDACFRLNRTKSLRPPQLSNRRSTHWSYHTHTHIYIKNNLWSLKDEFVELMLIYLTFTYIKKNWSRFFLQALNFPFSFLFIHSMLLSEVYLNFWWYSVHWRDFGTRATLIFSIHSITLCW